MEKLFIALDISNESIGGTLFAQSSGTATIIYSLRLPIIWEQPPTTEPLLIKIRQTLKNVVKELHDTGLKEARKHNFFRSEISKVFITYAAPWYLSQTNKIIAEYTKPLLITKDLVRALVSQHEKQFIIETKHHTHSALYHNIQIIERRIVDIKLNGYSTQKPYNKRAIRIELAVHTSFVSKDILTITQNAIDGYFHVQSIQYSSFPLVIFSNLRQLYTDIPHALIIDIRGETTDISLIQHNALLETVSFPYGSGALLREVSDTTNTSIHIAQSLVHMYNQRKPIPEVTIAVDPAIKKHSTHWIEEYSRSIAEITKHRDIPKTVYLITPSRLEKYFSNLLQVHTTQTQVTILHSYDLKESVAHAHTTDSPLVWEVYFTNQL